MACKRARYIGLIVLMAPILSSCSTPPRYPTDKEWSKTPIFRSDQKSVGIQGNFQNSSEKFLIASSNLKDGMSREEITALGFDPELKDQPCDAIGWLETSQMVLGNAVLNVKNIETAMENRKQYSAIRCRAKDVKTRTDRLFTYLSHKDTFGKGIDITVTVIFSENKVVGVDLNKKPIKNHDRQSAFLQVLSDVLDIPKINLNPNKAIP